MPTQNQMKIIQHLVTRAQNRPAMSSSFFTKEQASIHADNKARIISHTVWLNREGYYFFSDDHLFGYKDEKNKLRDVVPTTSYLPMSVTPRTGLEDGVVNTVDDYIKIFHKEDTLINSFDELIEFIEKHNLLIAEQ